MVLFGTLGFTAPWLLVALIGLPILWILLRAVPPAPIQRRFPGVALLLGLQEKEVETDRTPWWLLVLRALAIAGLIIGFAGPILNPETRSAGSGPLLIIADGTWADATDWSMRLDQIESKIAEAARNERTVAVATLTDLPTDLPFMSADVALRSVANLSPAAWDVPETAADWAAAQNGSFDTYWLSDGIDRDVRGDILTALQDRGTVTVFETNRPVVGLRPAMIDGATVTLRATRTHGGQADYTAHAIGLDPAGIERELASAPILFADSETETTTAFDLPPEQRNRVTRFVISGINSAGAVTLTDDSLKRREIALVSGGTSTESLQLLSPLHYLREALRPNADLIELPLTDAIPANPDVIILADVATISPLENELLTNWIEQGGMLLRFAGPRLAAAEFSIEADPLLPVRLRSGGRSVGGTMSWGEPKTLAPFAENSPFAGLTIPADVIVSAQVVAEPDPTLASRVIAQLTDGTPLVTRDTLGAGQIVLFHVTANAEWSNLPLSGLFVQMLERLSVISGNTEPSAEILAGSFWTPAQILMADGTLRSGADLAGTTGEDLAAFQPSADIPPGLYTSEERAIALNVIDAERQIVPATWPADITVETITDAPETPLMGWFLAAALALLCVDIIATLGLSGRLRGGIVTAFIAAMMMPNDAHAQSDAAAIAATSNVVLAHVITGDASVDDAAYAGLYGLSDTLTRRTSIEPDNPVGVNIETDELSFFPLIYWPITANQPMPSRDAYAKLNDYLRSGGMIVFDTRDADFAQYGTTTTEARKLQAIAAGLDIPPIERMPTDHILTRTFYLLQDFPGRYNGRDIWVEASVNTGNEIDGMPFRNLNDGVTPVVIGGNDWAAAWAMDDTGRYLFPVGRGNAGARQREIAFRFGVNLVMHVLTGNYKSDQVHVPALLDRLGE